MANKVGNTVGKQRFVAEVARVIVHYTVEVSPDLLTWMDSAPGRAVNTFKRLTNVDGIEEDSIEYNGHFGPYVYFACEQDKAPVVTKGVLKVIADCDRTMCRSAAHRARATKVATVSDRGGSDG